jgi:hypothetical protein
VAAKTEIFLTVHLTAWRVMPLAVDIPLAERHRIGQEKRQRGNRWYGRGDHSMAVQCYRKAVEYLDDEAIENEVEVCALDHALHYGIYRYSLKRQCHEVIQMSFFPPKPLSQPTYS